MAVTAKDLQKIIDGPGSKADRARALFGLGCDRGDVVELLGMSYSQAHSIYKALQDGWTPRAKADSSAKLGPRFIQYSPGQVRFLTQDSHVIVKIDKEGGTFCRNCDNPLTYSLRWLGFVHTFSHTDPTDVEDRYP